MAVPTPSPSLAPPTHALERTPEEWSELLGSWGEPKYRGLQVFRWLHQRGVSDAGAMTDLGKSLRAKLAEVALSVPISVAQTLESEDGTRKLLLSLGDQREVETVLIPMSSTQAGEGADDEDDEPVVSSSWVTQCISSQVGCAQACVFCASGIAGFKRHLSAAEIVGQVLLGKTHERVRNVVFMGMGEPLHNYDAVARSVVLLCHPEGIGLSKRRVTVSTSGLVPQIDRLGRDFGGQVQLAISLHAANDDARSEIMPINRKHPLGELMDSLARYPLPKRRRITIEYTLIEGWNASVGDARQLARLLRRIPCKVNLIPMNAVADNPLRAPSWDVVDAFQDVLRREGTPSFVRRRKGDDIAAACGQLALAGEKKKVRVALPVTR
jgi:23S rRNA (adenine2503-C2)-methyltransferase